MFTLTDFINLMNYFKGESVPDLDTNLIATAEDSKAKATTLFSESIDQTAHTTEDYIRLKNFLIPWYSSLKAFPSTMKNVSDIRGLPTEHLDELFKSFGFTTDLADIPAATKVDFFYDLVNLYKIKGTPESIERVITYFGIPDVDIMEFWLQFDKDRRLVFHPELLTNYGKNDSVQDLGFNYIVNRDPHWMLTEEAVLQLFENNKIAFPSKTPYFGIRPTTQLVGNIINPVMCLLTRIVLDQYAAYDAGNPPVKDTRLPTIDIMVSILDLYLSVLYTMNRLYPNTFDPTTLYTYVYNGDFVDSTSGIEITYADIIDEFDELIKRIPAKKVYDPINDRYVIEPASRREVADQLPAFNKVFTKLRSENFLTSLNTAEDVLADTNPDLKKVIDDNFDLDNSEYILQFLVKNLIDWMKINIAQATPNLLVSMFGFSVLTYIMDIINFFKPYRARLILIDDTFTIQLPALDSVIFEDYFDSYGIDLIETIYDFDTGDGSPGYPEVIEDIEPVYSTPPDIDARRINNIYVDSTGVVKCDYIDSTAYTLIQNIVYSNPPIGGYRVFNIYLELLSAGGRKLYVESSNTPVSIIEAPTRIYSIPLSSSYHKILDVCINDESYFEMLYDEGIWFSNDKLYYSRQVMDCDSYFDIGAFTDDPPPADATSVPLFTYIDDNIYEPYNTHKGDCTSEVTYSVDSTGAINEIIVLGAWQAYDEGLLYDLPPIPDRVEIFIQGAGPVLGSLYSDVIIDFHDNITVEGLSMTHLAAE